MFSIRFTANADRQLLQLTKRDQVRVVAAIDVQLTAQPMVGMRNRKRLRLNSLAHWELRIGDLRAFYDVAESASIVEIVVLA